MKTTKILTAIILCFAMVLSISGMAASAVSETEAVTFEYLDSTTAEKYYIGKAFTGYNYFKYVGGETDVFYEYEAQEDGFYAIDGYNQCVAQKVSETSVKQIESEAVYYNEGMYFIYLEAGTYYISDSFITSLPEAEDIDVTITYLGEFKEITYNKDAFKNAIKEADVDMYNKTLFNAEPKIVFENASLDDNGGHIGLNCNGELALGDNEVTFDIVGEEFSETLTVVDITEIVESIEVDNISKFTERKRTYRGMTVYYPEEITLNFTNGTSKNFAYSVDEDGEIIYIVELPDGREYVVEAEQSIFTFSLWLADHYYIDEYTHPENATFAENCTLLSESVNEIMNSDAGFFDKIIAVIDEFFAFLSFSPVLYVFG